MIDLGVVLEFVEKIETEGLQTLPQQEVAKRLKYAAQTSTPFYRRMVAARLFGLIDTTQGVNLTKLALDYFKPTDEESKKQALFTAVKNVVGYKGFVERFSGKRLAPVDILKNSIERDFNLASETARACAEVFIRSAQLAGLVRSDGTLSAAGPERPHAHPASEKPAVQSAPTGTSPSLAPVSEDMESHYLTLDAKQRRRVIVQAPPVITAAELKRIQNWLAVQLHVVESANVGQPEKPMTERAENEGATAV